MNAARAEGTIAPLRAAENVMPHETFHTSRLAATPLVCEDFPDYCRLFGDERVRAWLGGGPFIEANVKSALETALIHWQQHGFGIWTLREIAGGKFVGRAGLRHCVVEGAAEIELLYTLLPEFWNQGLATEAARAALDIGLAQLQLPSVVAFTRPTNVASRRVMEKCGMLYERPIVHAGLPHVLFRKKAPDSVGACEGQVAAQKIRQAPAMKRKPAG
jgi:RimJ/RimL family protein N-acetyltransferase